MLLPAFTAPPRPTTAQPAPPRGPHEVFQPSRRRPGRAPAMTKPLHAPIDGVYAMDRMLEPAKAMPDNDNREVVEVGSGNRTSSSIPSLRGLRSAAIAVRGLMGPEGDTAVYVIGTAFPNCVKIGRARCPVKRLATLQTGNPEPLFIHRVFWFLTPVEALRVEIAAHEYAAQEHDRLEGEWFECIPYQAHKHIVSAADEFRFGYLAMTPSINQDVAHAA